MGRKGISIDQLRDQIGDILNEYADNTYECLQKVATQYGKIGKKMLQQDSPKRTGDYAKGWAYARKTEKNTGHVNVTIHNKAKPGLPHLLEYGHATRNGGRTGANKHISPVEQQIVDEFVDVLTNEIQKL